GSSQKSSVAATSGRFPHTLGACWASSFGSRRSEGGSGDPEVRKCPAFITPRLPQPLYLSRPVGQSAHPVAASTSSACRSRILVTWLLVSAGSTPKRTPAAADTCGAANDVPSGWW